jgi:hypothetical protein
LPGIEIRHRRRHGSATPMRLYVRLPLPAMLGREIPAAFSL